MKPAPIGPEGPVQGWQRSVPIKDRVAMEIACQKAWFKHHICVQLKRRIPWTAYFL